MKNIIALFALILISFSAFSANAADPFLEFHTRYAALVKKANSTNYVYRLTPKQFSDAFDVKNQRTLLNDLLGQIASASGRGFSNHDLYKMEAYREEFELKHVAPLVNHLLSMTVPKINLAILTLARDFLMNDERRTAAHLLLVAIGEKQFSQAEKDRLASESAKVNQAVTGAKWGTGIVATVGVVFGVRKHGPGFMKNIKAIWRKAPQVASQAKAGIEKARALTVAEALQMAKQAGVRFSSDVSSNIVEIVIRQNKMRRLRAWALNSAKRGTIRDVLIMAGGNIAGAGTFVGYKALEDSIFPKTMANTIIDPNSLRDDYFDGLAALRLSCQVKALHPQALAIANKSASADTTTLLKALYKQFLSYYADYVYLKDATQGRFILPTRLNTAIKLDSATGKVTFRVKIKDKVQTEHFGCPALKGVKSHPVEVSMAETLDELTESFVALESVFFKFQ